MFAVLVSVFMLRAELPLTPRPPLPQGERGSKALREAEQSTARGGAKHCERRSKALREAEQSTARGGAKHCERRSKALREAEQSTARGGAKHCERRSKALREAEQSTARGGAKHCERRSILRWWRQCRASACKSRHWRRREGRDGAAVARPYMALCRRLSL